MARAMAAIPYPIGITGFIPGKPIIRRGEIACFILKDR